ncbi:MlaD family protein [Mariniblastus fucicola]|uniref:Paraquat-inducible protein B n=1 Tax=Mariniblastus fucicola TaxID=980251 RepID=A0A5B9PFM6_9BACT|nr:MlaD family protein [Mariniblastus fucicola]QEG23612.1 Paraquat-inducible protein B [Mariniblastus fucicola]
MNNPPVADIRPRSSKMHQLFGGSRLWLLTLLCLLIAGGLIWWSMPQRGTTIHIQFPEGHGLKTEDTVRYRGIEVGTVESVHLDDSLDGVEVEVLLKPSAEQLAKEGTRFWVVRPELSLTRISGLETAIGHKYIGVSPNPMADSENRQTTHRFQGLANVPVDTLSDSGVELILRGDKRYSVSKGSNVTFRGVEIGTVLDVALSQESRHVDVRVRIFDQHATLLTSESKFWASSGLDLDFQFGFNGGFNLDTESLETLARGGVSMITTGQGKSVSPGDIFTLHASAEDDWFKSAEKFETTNIALRGAVPIRSSWESSGYFGRSIKTAQCNGIAIINGGEQFIWFPADVMSNSKKIGFNLAVGDIESVGLGSIRSVKDSLVVRMESKARIDAFDASKDFISPVKPMDGLVVRQSAEQDVRFHLSIEKSSIKPDEDNENLWDVIDFNGDRNVWHGAPVVSAADGKLMGILLIESRKTKILTVNGLAN